MIPHKRVACVVKRSQCERSFLPKSNMPLQCSTRLAATTLNNSKFQDSKGATMDNDSMSTKTKTNNNDYIPSASIEYSLKLNHIQLLHFLHFELLFTNRWGQMIVLIRVFSLLFFIVHNAKMCFSWLGHLWLLS